MVCGVSVFGPRFVMYYLGPFLFTVVLVGEGAGCFALVAFFMCLVTVSVVVFPVSVSIKRPFTTRVILT